MLSREFLIERGYCCGHGCLMCPYEPKHTEGNTVKKKTKKNEKK
jgi:2,5-diketo-D-gluconate reductase A